MSAWVKVNHLTLPNAGQGVQTANGMIRGTLTEKDGFEMYLLRGMGIIEITSKVREWKQPAYISILGCTFSADEPLRKP